MKILPVTDPAFKKYGRIITNVDFTELVAAMKETPVPAGVVYEPSIRELEALPVMQKLSDVAYGEMPIQIGYCNGHNTKLNAVEYHRDSEINVAATDAILILGSLQDVEADHTYETSKMEAILQPAGVEGKGFQVAIVLPKGTNYPLKVSHPKASGTTTDNEDHLITAVNKWLIGHAEGGLEPGSFLGLKGENLDIAKE